jgi:glycosyltransferase involved in cell wall biosynthesis
MRATGIESYLLHTGSNGLRILEDGIIPAHGQSLHYLRKVLLRFRTLGIRGLYKNYKKELFSLGKGPISITQIEQRLKPDIIHLHWINNWSINYSSIKKANVPVFWTLRDMWPFTGGCHYSVNCEKYVDECGACPLLASKHNLDLSRLVFNYKVRNNPTNVHYIGISNWIIKEFQRTKFASSKVSYIPNGLRTGDWFPVPTLDEINEFAQGRKIILIGAVNLNAAYKGGKHISTLTSHLASEDYCVVAFGKIDENFVKSFKLSTLLLGVIKDEAKLRAVYSSCHVYFFPSILEAFGKTVVESILCGTPVVCFGNTGPGEIVEHKRTGYICETSNVRDIVSGIEFSSTLPISIECRREVAHRFSVKNTAKEMINLYTNAS